MVVQVISCSNCKLENLVMHGLQCNTCYRKQAKIKRLGRCLDCKQYKYINKKHVTCYPCLEVYKRRKLLRFKREFVKESSRIAYKRAKSKGLYSTESRRVKTAVAEYRRRDCNSEITEAWYLANVVGGSCHYCTIKEVEGKSLYGKRHGLDKKDPKAGYRSSNVVVCCQGCNTTKNNWWTEEEMKKIGTFINQEIYPRRWSYTK